MHNFEGFTYTELMDMPLDEFMAVREEAIKITREVEAKQKRGMKR